MTAHDRPKDHQTPVRMCLYRTRIPMRAFEHAAARRDQAASIVIRLEYQDGSAAWGQTLPRSYVTAETTDSVVRDLQEILWPLVAGRPLPHSNHPADLAFPCEHDGRCISAAACAMDLATVRRVFTHIDEIPSELLSALAGRSRARPRIDATASGVLGSSDPEKTRRHLWLMCFHGLSDFKLKLGFGDEIDAENLDVVERGIGRRLRKGTATLRVDANGAWDPDATPDHVAALAARGVCAVEQPVYCPAAELAELARRCELPLIADEALLTDSDAEALLSAGDRVWWNIRLAKNGGLLNALMLARRAADANVPFVAGCMVGESCILSAAQRRLLQMGPEPRFVEGNWGRWLMYDDLVAGQIRFGRRGKMKALRGDELGVTVDPAKVFRYSEQVASCEA